jgi:hypothetical protein
MPRSPRVPFHPSLFAPAEVPAGEAYRPRLRPVQPTASVHTTSNADLAQLLNDLIRRSVLAQVAVSRLDEAGWGLIEAEMGRFFARGGVATLMVGRLFDLPRAAGVDPAAWRAAARPALERGLRFWARVTAGAVVCFWPRFHGNLSLFDAVGALHALVGSSPLTERALRRSSGDGRCEVSLHLTAADPEWATGEMELEERAAMAAALYPFYGFFNGELPRKGPDRPYELTPVRVAQALAALDHAVEVALEAGAAPGADAVAVEARLLRTLAEEAEDEPFAEVVLQADTLDAGTLLLGAAARPLLQECAEGGDPVLFRMPQPRFDFRATVQANGRGAAARFALTGVPPSRVTALLRRAYLRPGDPLTLVQQGPRTIRVLRS